MKRSIIFMATLLFSPFIAAKGIFSFLLTASLALSVGPLSRTAINFVLTADSKNAQDAREYMQKNPILIDLLKKYTEFGETTSTARTQEYKNFNNLLKAAREQAAIHKQTIVPSEPETANAENMQPVNTEHVPATSENPYSGQQ